jgi:diaminohydroxyphosphoribosylaminopyrimidine deaminase/5-amino-6-(5-phosphoribosylamino)uracil reductase
MGLDLLTACSINGVLSPARSLAGLGLIEALGVPPNIVELHRGMRRRYDAVLAGPNTVLLDNPPLTSHAAPGFTCVRATLDPAGKIPPDYRFLDGSVRTLIGVSRATPKSYLQLLAERGVEALRCGESRVDLRSFVEAMAARGLGRVLVEGGGRLNRALLDQQLVEQIHLLLMPVVLDSGAVNAFEGRPDPLRKLRLAEASRLDDFLLLRYSVHS